MIYGHIFWAKYDKFFEKFIGLYALSHSHSNFAILDKAMQVSKCLAVGSVQRWFPFSLCSYVCAKKKTVS